MPAPTILVTDPITPFESLLNSIGASLNAERAIRTYKLADLDALLSLASGVSAGDLATVTEGGAIFRHNGTIWVQVTPALFATPSIRDSAYAKASGGYKVPTAQVFRTDMGWTEAYASSAWVPLTGKMPFFQLVRDKVPTIPNNAETILESTFTWTATPVNRGGFTYSAGVVTIPISGTYMVSASIAFASNGAGQRHITVLKNGTAVGTNAVLYNEIAASSTTNGIVACSGPLQLAAGDTLQLAVWQNSGAGLAVANFGDAHTAASSFFTIAAMSA